MISGESRPWKSGSCLEDLHCCDGPVFPAGGRAMKGEPAPELGCCHKTKPLGSTGASLSPYLDSQLCQDGQVM